MPRDYETPDDYAGIDYDGRDDFDAHADRDADREEAAVRRWEARREMPYEDEPEPEDTLVPDCPSCDAPGYGRYSCPRCGWHKADHRETDAEHYAWLRREEYGDQDNPGDVEVAA